MKDMETKSMPFVLIYYGMVLSVLLRASENERL